MTIPGNFASAVVLAALLFSAGTASAQEARAPATDLLTLDSHVDIPDAYMREARFDAGTDSVLQADIPKLRKGGLDAIFLVVYVGQGPLNEAGYAQAVARAENKFSAIDLLLRKYPDQIRLATSPAQVRANHEAGLLSATIGVENGYALGHDLARLDQFHARGARYLGLTHAGDNDLCTSSAPNAELGQPVPAVSGLTGFGRQVVRRANELGVMVDVSHASDACIREVLQASSAPIIASHSSARALVAHPRNVPDDLAKAIAAKGGVIQVVAYREFVKADPERYAAQEKLEAEIARRAGDAEYDSEKHEYLPSTKLALAELERQHPLATVEHLVDHIQHLVGVVGVDHVGIASDFDGTGGVTGWMDASETGNVTAALRRRGFSDGDISKIWSGNLLRAWSAVEAVAAQPNDDKATAARAPAPAATPARSPTPVRAPAPAHAGNEVESIVDAVVARYQLPGIAVGVIENGVITDVVTRGELVAGTGQAVTPAALFKIASNSKAMTASLLARLVQAGKLRWDDPVVKHLPRFRLHDNWVTRNLLVRDLLVHNSGLPEGGGDLMLWPEPNQFTRADILAGLAHIPSAYSFRSGYAYDNTLYIVAGELAAAVGGASYEQLMQREVFEPLGLRCRVGAFRRDEVGPVAQPHRRLDGVNVAAKIDGVLVPGISSAAAGGIRCSLDDMLAWARNWLDPTPAQLGWLSAAGRAEMVQPRTPMPVSERRRRWNNTHALFYAFGFRVADMDGIWTVSHTGTLSGMYSAMSLLPDRRSGFVFMINADADEARTVLSEALLKHFTAPGRGPSVASLADELQREAAAPSSSRAPDISAQRPATVEQMRTWLGLWRDPWFGVLSVCEHEGAVRFSSTKSPMLRGRVTSLGADWLVEWDRRGVDEPAWLRFTAATGDGRPTMRMAKVDPDADFSYDYEDLKFERFADCDAVSTAATASEAGLVDIATLVPDIDLDIRYATRDNFVGAPVDGYRAPKCLLREEVAQDLRRVEEALRRDRMRLRILDCYRPARAVQDFVRWAAAPDDPQTKASHYPNLAKSTLLGEYIAPVSGHSRGATVDLTLLDCSGASCQPLDMGTGFDFFDPSANTASTLVTAAQSANRQRLVAAMAAEGFQNYPMEWWHFTRDPASVPKVRYDLPIR